MFNFVAFWIFCHFNCYIGVSGNKYLVRMGGKTKTGRKTRKLPNLLIKKKKFTHNLIVLI